MGQAKKSGGIKPVKWDAKHPVLITGSQFNICRGGAWYAGHYDIALFVCFFRFVEDGLTH